MSEDVDEYLDDVETVALSWDLSISLGISEATNKSKSRLFRQNLQRDGDAGHWWYYILSEADKRDFSKIVIEFRERYGIKASQASSLFAVQNEMLSLLQGENEHIREYVHRVEKLSRKIPKDMDSLFAIAFIKGMRDQERRQWVTFDLKDSPNFSFLKALTVVKFSFHEIGEPDLFRPTLKICDTHHPQTALYSPPVVPQVNAVAVTDMARPTGEQSALPAAMTQEQFNMFMAGYEASVRQSPRSPYTYGPLGSSLNNRRANSRITCFNCGQRGHYSDMCSNPPVSSFEQQQLRDRLRRERDQNDMEYLQPDRRLEPPATGANKIELTPRMILPRPGNENQNIWPSPPPAVSCIRSCQVSRSDLGNACVVAAQIPAVRTIFQNAMAEKRARVEENDLDSHSGHRASKTPRRIVEGGESSSLRRSLRHSNNQQPQVRATELEPVVEVEVLPHPDQDESIEFMEITDQLEDTDIGEIGLRQTIVPTSEKGKGKAEVAPINWMKSQSQFTIQDALNGPRPGLQITLPQLLDYSPRLRRDLAELLRSSVPRVRKKRLAAASSGLPAALHSSKLPVGQDVTCEAAPGTDENIEYLYIEAWVGNFKIPEMLVDAGAMLDLISTPLVNKLKLPRYPVTGLGMRLADDHLVVLRNYVWVDVIVAGILARVKAYEVAVSQTYHLLLSRRWLKRVRAVEYHDTRTLYIEGGDHIRRKVPGIPVDQTGIKMESLDPPTFFEVDDDDAEEAIETLLNELDNWKEDGKEAQKAENL